MYLNKNDFEHLYGQFDNMLFEIELVRGNKAFDNRLNKLADTINALASRTYAVEAIAEDMDIFHEENLLNV